MKDTLTGSITEDIRVPTARLETFKRSFFWNAIALWNILPNFMRNSLTLANLHGNLLISHRTYLLTSKFKQMHVLVKGTPFSNINIC